MKADDHKTYQSIFTLAELLTFEFKIYKIY